MMDRWNVSIEESGDKEEETTIPILHKVLKVKLFFDLKLLNLYFSFIK